MSAALQVGILVVLCFMATIAVVNVLTLRSLGFQGLPHTFPLVSVLIPARNEQGNIGQCIASLVDQEYPKYEVLVLDDNSQDETAAIVQKWAERDSRVHYLKGRPLEQGWVGKNFACHQLSQAARGEVLLFVDADTRHSRRSILNGVAASEQLKADLLTVIPNQTMSSFWERTILPLLHFSTFCFLPFPLVDSSRDPRFAMANGQYMLFRRRAYDAIGGHHAVKDLMVEDVWLARLVKSNGFALRILDGGNTISCRMYSSLKSIWYGFSKNLFAGLKFSLPAISCVVLFNFLTSVLPYVLLASILLGGTTASLLPIVAAQITALLGIRAALSARFKMSYVACLVHPLAMMMLIGIAATSVWWILVAGGSQWKGREYRFKKKVLATIRSTS